MNNMDRSGLERVMFDNIMARVVDNAPGLEKLRTDLPTNKVISNFIGLDFDNVKKASTGNGEGHVIMRGLINSIESRVEKFSLKGISLEQGNEETDINFANRYYRSLVAMEAEEEAEEKKDDEDYFGDAVEPEDVDEKIEKDESTIAVMVSDLIKEIVKTDAKEVNELAERVVDLSKTSAEDAKDEKEADDDIFSTVDKDGDNDEDDEGKKKTKSIFDEDDDDGEIGEETKKSLTGDGKMKSGIPTSSKVKDEDKVGKENREAKYVGDLKMMSYGMERIEFDSFEINPFLGLNNKSINSVAKYIADGMVGEDLLHAVNNYGTESDTFRDVKKKYLNVGREALNGTIGALLTASILNIPVESYKLNNVELFGAQ